MKVISTIISYFFHPLFVVAMMLGILLVINPYLFGINKHAEGLLIISVVTMSIMFPMISVALMKMLGLIDTLEMKGDKERVGPLIASGIFYLWLFVNIKNNNMVPQAFSFFVLGSTIALFIAFFISNFSRISLHTIGIGGLLMGLILIRYNFAYDTFILNLKGLGSYSVHMDLVIIVAIIICGLVGTARLYLKAHDSSQVMGGYLVGITSQVLAFLIFF